MAHVRPILEVRNLSCGYSGTPVCGPVSAIVSSGETVGVVGFNGTGKSTVMRSISGRQTPLSGQVYFKGVPRDDGSTAWRRSVAVVFDDDAWFPGLTVAEHLQLVAAGHAVQDPARALERELEFFGLAERADALPESLSSGQRRRLLLAAAFIRPAELYLLDEPEQRLDPAMITDLGHRLNKAREAGAATVVVTHDPEFLTQVAQRCLVINDVVHEVTPAQGARVITKNLT